MLTHICIKQLSTQTRNQYIIPQHITPHLPISFFLSSIQIPPFMDCTSCSNPASSQYVRCSAPYCKQERDEQSEMEQTDEEIDEQYSGRSSALFDSRTDKEWLRDLNQMFQSLSR